MEELMNDQEAPLLSVIVVTPSDIERLERTLIALQKQTICQRLEVILIVPFAESAEQDAQGLLGGFQSVQVVPIGTIHDVTQAGAHGIPYAQAKAVAFVEDHAYPFPNWAESLVHTHQGPWAAVGSAFVCSNSDSLWAWASQIFSYPPYTAPVTGGEVDHLPAHNVSYKRDLLLHLDPPVDQLMSAWGGDLNIVLRDQGYRLYLDNTAVVNHRNTTVVKELLHVSFIAGRYYAGRRWRKEHWSIGRRLLYVLGSPLIPFKRGYQLWLEAFQGKERSDIMPGVSLRLAPLLAADGAGQMIGFLIDEGDAANQMAQHELVDRRTIS